MIHPVVRAVGLRDLRSAFGNPTSYIFILLFVLCCAAALVLPQQFFQNNLAGLDTLNEWFPGILLLFVPAITMGMWTHERAHGTQELLFTLPATDWQILHGKFLAGVGVFTISLLFTMTLPIGLGYLGDPDWGQVLSNYLGYWLLGVMLISVAMVGSQLTDNLAVSFILGVLGCWLVVYSGGFLRLALPAVGVAWQLNGPLGQFGEFARGVITPAGILLFAGLTAAFLYLNLALLSRRNWRLGDATGPHRAVRFASMAVGAVALTLVGVNVLPRLDGTVERIHSLSGETRKLLAQLDRNKPVFVTAYLSQDVPQEYVQTQRTLRNLIDQYGAIGGSAVQVRVVLTEAYSQEAREAEKNFGIQPRVMRTQEGADSVERAVFLGLAFQCGTEEVVLPFVDVAQPIEYEMTRSIRTVARADRRKVGVLKTDVELSGGFDFQTFQQKPRWQITEELKLQYRVENVDPDTDYPEGLDALVVPQPSSLAQEPMDRLRRWIEAGNPTLLLEDPEPLDAPGTAATDPKGGRQNPMMGMQQPPGQKGNLAGLLGAFGLSMQPQDLVWDISYRAYPGWRMPPEFLFVGPEGMDGRDPVTKGLQRIVLLLSGHLRIQDKPGLAITPLLRSVAAMSGTIPKLSVFQFNPFGGPKQFDDRRRHTPRTQEYVLAARVVGKPAEGKDKGVNLVVLADLDMIGNQFFMMRQRALSANLQFDNVTFVLNCIDHLVGDTSLIELRKRRPVLRTLTTIEAAQKEFEELWIEQREQAEMLAADELQQAQARLDEAVAKVRDNPELDERAKEIQVESIREIEQRNLDIRRSQIEDEKRKKLEVADYDRNASKRALQSWYQGWTLGLTCLPALCVALLMFFRRIGREARIVPQRRMVSGGES